MRGSKVKPGSRDKGGWLWGSGERAISDDDPLSASHVTLLKWSGADSHTLRGSRDSEPCAWGQPSIWNLLPGRRQELGQRGRPQLGEAGEWLRRQ